MATLTLILDTRNKKATIFPVVIQVSHRSMRKMLATGFKAPLTQWDDKKKKLMPPYQNSGRANARIQSKWGIANGVILREQENLKNLTVYEIFQIIEKEIQEKLNENILSNTIIKEKEESCLFEYGEYIISTLKKAERFGHARSVQDGIDSLRKFSKADRLPFSKVSVKYLNEYEADCRSKDGRKGQKMSINSIGAYLRSIRLIYNAAIIDKDARVSKDLYPFGKGGYKIKTSKTAKRAIKEENIDAIRNLKLLEGSPIWNARNYFLWMFNMRGMNFIDVAFLKRPDLIEDDRLIYYRRKTHKAFNIKLTKEAKEILSYYLSQQNPKELVFPILSDVIGSKNGEYIRETYRNKTGQFNKYLKKIAALAEIQVSLTSYVTRHSFATIGKNKGVSKSMIGDMLGHSHYGITETYFADFEQEVMDDAADRVFE